MSRVTTAVLCAAAVASMACGLVIGADWVATVEADLAEVADQ